MAGDQDKPSGDGGPSNGSAGDSADASARAGQPSMPAETPSEKPPAGGDSRSSEDEGEDKDDPQSRTCAGTTKTGAPCGRRVSEGTAYCYLHRGQAGTGIADELSDEVHRDAVDRESAVLDDYEPRQGPAEDREMPLADHIEEMLKRLAVVVGVAGVVSLVTFPFAEYLINLIWNGVLPAGEVTRPRLYGILELKLTELKVASLVGLIAALPALVYETYQFMKPGLYPHERRYYLAAIPTSLVLALVGVSFAYFIVLPAIFTYFLFYSQDVATIGFALGRTFDLILLLMGYLALVFQIPLFIMLAMMMGLVTRQWLADRRLLFWGGFLGISFVFSPDPTGMAPVVVALTMVALFEGTLLLTKWTSRGRAARRARSADQ